MARLNERIERLGPAAQLDVVAPRGYLPSVSALAALAAGAFMVAYMAYETTKYFAPPNAAPVRATIADLQSLNSQGSPLANAAFVASVPTGMPVWPAVLMVGQAPIHFASLDFHDGELER